jgi:hypothetical protein
MTNRTDRKEPPIHFMWPGAGLAICGADILHGAPGWLGAMGEQTCQGCLRELAGCGAWPDAADLLHEGTEQGMTTKTASFGWLDVTPHRQGIDLAYAEEVTPAVGQTPLPIKVRYAIHHDTSYPSQSSAAGYVWNVAAQEWHAAVEVPWTWAKAIRTLGPGLDPLTVGAEAALYSLRVRMAALLDAPKPKPGLPEGTE